MQLSVGFYLISKIVMIVLKITFKKEHVKGGVYTWLDCMHDPILTGLRSSAEKEEPKKSITITVQVLKIIYRDRNETPNVSLQKDRQTDRQPLF